MKRLLVAQHTLVDRLRRRIQGAEVIEHVRHQIQAVGWWDAKRSPTTSVV